MEHVREKVRIRVQLQQQDQVESNQDYYASTLRQGGSFSYHGQFDVAWYERLQR